MFLLIYQMLVNKRKQFYVVCIICIQSSIVHGFGDEVMVEELRTGYGQLAAERGAFLQTTLKALRNQTIERKLQGINDYFNQSEYRTDRSLWGVEDYWATPVEFMGKFAGDCEDFVISKYFALRELGVPDEKLFLTYAKATKQGVAHMVLNYFENPDSVPLVLDNYELQIKSADKREDLIPLYSFNASSLFLSNPSAGLGKALPTDKIRNSKWESLLKDMKVRNK